ncbi:4Fe-4S dicluster domain-containing protein [Paenibacillus radicis (ex Gao et al. 2016)]|uniref:Ferredoxin n=1 Tax=Paenibacillus radicis (ex Gao et al. 2016) TaxID=1737354 RepID=A0A917HC25_9BACL|nr:ferredoxin family protein [Paenibacillus radicis (ex Gao et al. 2016)]GGG74071.1 ferredoxin [Paenibacillus radicis (ex Gao et al. 2016)]
MIEIVSETRCISCNQCVKVCPTNVFDRSESGLPIIARQDDCQTCFMCELYCPTDALFVSPHDRPAATLDEEELAGIGLLGGYREQVGWGKGRSPGAARDATYLMFKEMQKKAGH